MSSEILIRRAEFKDADTIASIHWRSRKEAMPWLRVVHSALETRGFVARVLLKQDEVYVATRAGKVIGYAAWNIGRRERWLNHLYVSPDDQNRGVGALLFAHATRAMPDGFRFWVFQRNAAARAFYERRGAKVVRETDGRDNEEHEPDVEYAWQPGPRPPTIEDTVRKLRERDVVGIPTETVYGLAADARQDDAVAKIFALKGRPATNPLIVHVASVDVGERYAVLDDRARRLFHAFAPGPLTIVLPKKQDGGISDLVTAGLATVGIRIPAHPAALALLRAFDGPVAAPSANKSNHISPTTAGHVREEFGEALLVLDGGACGVGVESTVLDLSCTDDKPTILRPGAVTREQIESIIGPVDVFSGHVESSVAAMSPGQQAKHYAPRKPAWRMERGDAAPAMLSARSTLICFGAAEAESGFRETIVLSDDPAHAARQIYAALRNADKQQSDAIVVAMPAMLTEWSAVRDRLTRATQPIGEAT